MYDPQAGTLDLHAQGDRGVKARLVYIFCSVIPGANPPPEQPGNHSYELNPLLARGFPLPTDPQDGIESVRVRKMRLSVGRGGWRILLEANLQGGPQDLYDLIDDCLNAGFLAAAA